MLFVVILLCIVAVSGAAVLWMELSIMKDQIVWSSQKIFDLNNRLNKLEKDAVKVTFTGEPQYYGMRTTPQDVEKILNPKKDKVMGEWQTKNKTKVIVNPTKKRKPKTVKEWKDEIDLGGHE